MKSYLLLVRLLLSRGCPLLLLVLLVAGCADLLKIWPNPAQAAPVPALAPPADVAVVPRKEISSRSPVTAPPPYPVSVAGGARTRVPKPSRFLKGGDLIYRNQTLSEDVTWRGEVLIEGALVIASQATVKVAPGTIVRFRSAPSGAAGVLMVHGRLTAAGTETEPVLFTTDSIDPGPGDWQGLLFLDSAKKNLLEWCRIDAAVTGVDVRFSDLTLRRTTVSRCRTGVSLYSSSGIIAGGELTMCTLGMTLIQSDLDADGVRIINNDRGVLVADSSLYLAASEVLLSTGAAVEATGVRLRLDGTRLTRNHAGLVCDDCRGDVVNSSVEENRTSGLDLTDSLLRITDNRISGNGGSGVVIRSGGGTLWRNSLAGNHGPALATLGTDDVVAPENWWGSADPAVIRGQTREGCADGSCGRIWVVPPLAAPPVAGK